MPPARHIRSLDTLRGIAALSVAGYHARFAIGHPGLLPHAYLCVDLFFVLSSFVLEHRYGRELRDGGLTIASFMRTRFARLYPLYLAATLACMAWVVVTLQAQGALKADAVRVAVAGAANALVVPVPPVFAFRADLPLFPFNPASWSIFWEFVFSFLFAAWMRAGGRGLGFIVGAAAVLLVVNTGRAHAVDFGWTADRGWIGGGRALLGFALGVLCRRVFVAVERGGPRLRATYMAGGLAAGLAVFDYLWIERSTRGGFEALCVTLLFPMLVCGLALAEHRLLANRVGDALGGMSYSIYLLHGLVLAVGAAVVKRATHGHPPPHGGAMLGALLLAALLAVSWAVWRGFERPAQRWVLRRGRPRLRHAPTALSPA